MITHHIPSSISHHLSTTFPLPQHHLIHLSHHHHLFFLLFPPYHHLNPLTLISVPPSPAQPTDTLFRNNHLPSLLTRTRKQWLSVCLLLFSPSHFLQPFHLCRLPRLLTNWARQQTAGGSHGACVRPSSCAPYAGPAATVV